MPTYHINQVTGRAGRCTATHRNCPVGGKHFDTLEEADLYYEKIMADELLVSQKRQGERQIAKVAPQEAQSNFVAREVTEDDQARWGAWAQQDDASDMSLSPEEVARRAGERVQREAEQEVIKAEAQRLAAERESTQAAAFQMEQPADVTKERTLVIDGEPFSDRIVVLQNDGKQLTVMDMKSDRVFAVARDAFKGGGPPLRTFLPPSPPRRSSLP